MDTKVSNDSWLVSLSMFVAWIASSLLAVIAGLYFRDAVLSVASIVQAAQYHAFKAKGGFGLDLQTGYMVSFFDTAMLFTLGIAAIVFVIWVEYYFRKGRAKGLLFKRMGIVFGVELGVILVSILVRQFI